MWKLLDEEGKGPYKSEAERLKEQNSNNPNIDVPARVLHSAVHSSNPTIDVPARVVHSAVHSSKPNTDDPANVLHNNASTDPPAWESIACINKNGKRCHRSGICMDLVSKAKNKLIHAVDELIRELETIKNIPANTWQHTHPEQVEGVIYVIVHKKQRKSSVGKRMIRYVGMTAGSAIARLRSHIEKALEMKVGHAASAWMPKVSSGVSWACRKHGTHRLYQFLNSLGQHAAVIANQLVIIPIEHCQALKGETGSQHEARMRPKRDLWVKALRHSCKIP